MSRVPGWIKAVVHGMSRCSSASRRWTISDGSLPALQSTETVIIRVAVSFTFGQSHIRIPTHVHQFNFVILSRHESHFFLRGCHLIHLRGCKATPMRIITVIISAESTSSASWWSSIMVTHQTIITLAVIITISFTFIQWH